MNISRVQWIFLSPHLDDAVLSCGGLIWEQVQSGSRVENWTICSGFIPLKPLSSFAQEQHTRWNTGPQAVQVRREEDRLANERLGSTVHFFDIPDCIYRYRQSLDGEIPLIQREEDLWQAVPEDDLVGRLAQILKEQVPNGARVVCPMTVGEHVDHRLVRASAELSGLPLYYYADYPYVLTRAQALAQMEEGHWRRNPASISDLGLAAWMDAIAAYQSQFVNFWSNMEEMRLAIRNYWAGGGGRLWKQN